MSMTLFLKLTKTNDEEEAQLPQRNSASAAHMDRGGLGPPAHSPSAPSGYTCAYGRIRIHNVRTSSVPSVKRTLRWIGHSRSFKVIVIGAGRNLEWSIVVMCNWCRRYLRNLQRYGNGKTANSSISTTSRRFEDGPARNAFEYLQMIYIARN